MQNRTKRELTRFARSLDIPRSLRNSYSVLWNVNNLRLFSYVKTSQHLRSKAFSHVDHYAGAKKKFQNGCNVALARYAQATRAQALAQYSRTAPTHVSQSLLWQPAPPSCPSLTAYRLAKLRV